MVEFQQSSQTFPVNDRFGSVHRGRPIAMTDVLTRGATTLFSQHYVLNDDGTRASVHEVQAQPDTTLLTSDTTWTYDADQRLTGEQVVASSSNYGHHDVFTYDLAGNRISDAHAGPGSGSNSTIGYTYNNDDELTQQVTTTGYTPANNTIAFSYDPNGSQTSSTIPSHTPTSPHYPMMDRRATFEFGGRTEPYSGMVIPLPPAATTCRVTRR